MQDSLEDYIRLVNNTKQNIVGNLNHLEKTISWEKKQQYENYAFKIIEFMIEGRLQPQVFVKSLNFIHQEHYQDIIEERAVTKLCGYPICGKRLPPMPKKQFHISTKLNKIYDITDRKLFCCNYCYQASDFIKKQIDTSPLWSRRPEDFPRFILLDQNEILRPGIEVDHGLAKLPADHNFTSINSFTEACLDEAEEMEYIRQMQEREEEEKVVETKTKSILKKKKRVANKDRIEEEDENQEGGRELEIVNNLQTDVKIGLEEDAQLNENINGLRVESLEINREELQSEMENPERVEEDSKEEIIVDIEKECGVQESTELILQFADKCKIEEKPQTETEKSILVIPEVEEEISAEFVIGETIEIKPKIEEIFEKELISNELQVKEESKIEQSRELSPTLVLKENPDKCVIKLVPNKEECKIKSENNSKIEESKELIQDKTNLEKYLEKLQVEAKCKIEKSAEKKVKTLQIKTRKLSNESTLQDKQIKKKVTIKPEYSEPSTSGQKNVRFKIDPHQNSYSHCHQHSKTPNADSQNRGVNMKIPEEELADFREYIQGICKSMGITPRGDPKPKERPVEINKAKMRLVIEKVNASEESRNRRAQLITTDRNPERTKPVAQVKPKYAHRIAEENLKAVKNLKKKLLDENLKHHPEPLAEMPKYAHRVLEKVKMLEEDENLKVVIEKVKNLSVNKSIEEGKLKEVLEKIKRKEGKPKGSILINTSINPEVEMPKKKDPITPKPVEILPDLEKIRATLLQWLTLETYIFIHGDARIKRILNEATLDGYFEKLKVAELETAKQVRYMNICKKLQLREMAEEKFDGVLLNSYEQRKPLPDYSRLKEESKDMDLKVKAFFVGSVYEKADPNFKVKKDDGGEVSPAVLPLVDAGSQNVVRRKIFINAVSKYVQIHINELELDDSLLIEVQNMIKTFKFEADNIIFKAQMWNVIGFVLIVMMSCKCDALKNKLAFPSIDIYRNLIFSKYCDGNGFLQQVLHIVESVEIYVKNYIISD